MRKTIFEFFFVALIISMFVGGAIFAVHTIREKNQESAFVDQLAKFRERFLVVIPRAAILNQFTRLGTPHTIRVS